jgi:uncharacterized protein DUF3592
MIWGGMVLCGSLSFCGILLMVGGFRDWRISTASANWPTTDAEIVGSEVVKRIFPATRYSPSREDTTYKVSFRYAVNGKDYTSEATLAAGALQPASEGQPPGTVLSTTPDPAARARFLTVRYDPADPATAIADPNRLAGGPIGIGVGVLLTLMGLSFLFVLWTWLPKRGCVPPPRSDPSH